VDGTSNFFAGEVLVHNCLIIDDPIKDLEQAQSAVYRERFQRFWQGVAVPRLGPGARAVLISTRWHEEDPAGWLLQHEGRKEDGGRWTVVNIPAQAEDDNDPLGRQPGEYMISARGNRDWEGVKKSVGAYVWSALYQGRPSPAEGGLFKRLWWRYWTPAPADPQGERLDLAGRIWPLHECWRFITGDLAASTRTSADYTVAAAWAITLDGDLVLLDRVKAKVGEANHFDLFRPLANRWQVDTAFIEKSFISSTLAIDATRNGLHITPIAAEGDKFSRALPASAKVSAGRVWLPAAAPWLGDFVDEAAGFPNAAHDDQVDTLSYAVRVAVTKWIPQTVTNLPAPTTGDVDLMSVPL
jgi:predicted phage terminase large subunit-like protein